MSKKKRYISKKIQNRIADKRINKLFQLAEKNALLGDFFHANRYIEIARAISMRNRISIPKEFKRYFCKHCYDYLLPGVNSRVRINRGKLIIYCNNCNKYTRIIFKKD